MLESRDYLVIVKHGSGDLTFSLHLSQKRLKAYHCAMGV